MFKCVLCAALLAACLVWAGCSDSQPPPPPRKNAPSSGGRSAPSPSHAAGANLFRLPRVDGQPVTVNGPTALFFFTTWCGYCKQALPEINRQAERARARGYQVYGIDVNEGPEKVNGFIQQYQPNFPVLLDTQGTVASQYGVRGYPTFVVIDQNSNIIYNGHDVPKNF